MIKFILRWLINAEALFLAIRFVSGITFGGGWLGLFLLAFAGGVAGVWVVRGQVLQFGSDVAAVADQALQRGQTATTALTVANADVFCDTTKQTRLTGSWDTSRPAVTTSIKMVMGSAMSARIGSAASDSAE